jgi:hypothetical protein
LRRLFSDAGLVEPHLGFLLFLPEPLARVFGAVEDALRWLPLGGQYFLSSRVPTR